VIECYEQHLGLKTNPFGAIFEWYESTVSPIKYKHIGHLFRKKQKT